MTAEHPDGDAVTEEVGDPEGDTTFNPDDPDSGVPDDVDGPRAVGPAPACRVALAEATQRWPGRSRASDGIMGDSRHCPGSSDHCTGNAFDLTHDPARGCNAHALGEALKQRRDGRVKYIISNKRIWNPSISPDWRHYSGSNPHTSHLHVSIHAGSRDNTAPWWGQGGRPNPYPGPPPLRRGSRGPAVLQVQLKLNIDNSSGPGIFGPRTEAAVRDFQRRRQLDDDGIVGPVTWNALFG